MSEKRDFYGKDVTDAILLACTELGQSQESLDIDIIEAGSAGIFGFARKQAHIQVSPKKERRKASESSFAVGEIFDDLYHSGKTHSPKERQSGTAEKRGEIEQKGSVSKESAAIVEKEVMRLVGLLGISAQSEIAIKNSTLHLTLFAENNDELIGEEGRVIDALQYLTRKIVGRQIDERISIILDVDGYREKRLQSLQKRAVRLAELVRKEGKPQIIPALNPAERREIHLILQEEKGVRSRSIGDGIFRKIVISKSKGQKTKSKR